MKENPKNQIEKNKFNEEKKNKLMMIMLKNEQFFFLNNVSFCR